MKLKINSNVIIPKNAEIFNV